MAPVRLPAWARPHDMLDLFRLAMPVALARASYMLMSLTDAVVLSRNRPGELPFILNGWLPIGVMFGFGMGLMLGVQVLTAELNGRGKGGETGRIFRRGLLIATGFALVATIICVLVARPLLDLVGLDPSIARPTAECTRILAFGAIGHMGGLACQYYLEALRKPNIATAIAFSAVCINLIVDLLLVPQYGAQGVAWATTISRYIMLVMFLGAVTLLTPAWRRAEAGPKGEFIRQASAGVGTGVANIAEWGSFNFTFVIATLVSLGAGTVYGLTVQFMGVVFMLYVGLGTAAAVRTAERFGREDRKGVRESSLLGLAAALVVGATVALMMFVSRGALASFGLARADVRVDDVEVTPLLSAMIGAAAAVTIFDGLQGVASMMLRAQGVVWAPTAIHIGSYVLVMLPLCWWLAFGLGLGVWGVFSGIAAASVIAGAAQAVTLERKSARGVRIGGAPRAAGPI